MNTPFKPVLDLEGIAKEISNSINTEREMGFPPMVFVGDGVVCSRAATADVLLALHRTLASRLWPS